jgi:hypothetical protein
MKLNIVSMRMSLISSLSFQILKMPKASNPKTPDAFPKLGKAVINTRRKITDMNDV